MALDEVLLETADAVWLRVFAWEGPWVSFGYSQSLGTVRPLAGERPLVRRWTGGGVVEHDRDWTFSLMVPRSDPAAALRPSLFYQELHQAVGTALAAAGVEARLAGEEDVVEGPACFTAPAAADVLAPTGSKLCGGAQRRARNGILHQGSIQNTALPPDFGQRLAGFLASHCEPATLTDDVEHRARVLAEEKYAPLSWLARIS